MLQKLGDTRESAIRQLKNLEKKLEKQPQIKREYMKFMQEYLQLGHMREVQKDSARWNIWPQYYMPHHCVIKDTSVTTKLRVVFNASYKTKESISLNDALRIGSVIQRDLFSILVRFRTFKVGITADIKKMYRQIRIEEDQMALQRIVWRDEPFKEIKTYELTTLTYGTSSASFVATKSIHTLAELEQDQFPLGAIIARRDFYMDDLITGVNSVQEAVIIRDQVTTLLSKGKFVLRKWASNREELLKDILGEETDNAIMELDKDGSARTLGVNWNYKQDVFQYSIRISRISSPTPGTKRVMLSSIAQIFDPLGLLAPIIITAKILIQELWKLQIDWDQPCLQIYAINGQIMLQTYNS